MPFDNLKLLLDAIRASDYKATTEMLAVVNKGDEIIVRENPLTTAVSNNDVVMIKLLSQFKWVPQEGESTVLDAVKNNHVNVETLKQLIKLNYDVNKTDRHGLNALHISAKYNYIDKLEVLLQSRHMDINTIDDTGRNALHHLIENGASKDISEIMRCSGLLLDRGVNVNAQDKMCETPLHKIFQNYSTEIPDLLKFFYEKVPEVNHELVDLQGYTVFHIMCSSVVDVLAESGKFEQVIKKKEAMLQGILNGSFVDLPKDMISRLLNDQDKTGTSAFMTYMDDENISNEKIQIMIEKGANVNMHDNLKITVLMKAVIRQLEGVVDLLLKSGADVNATDIFGQSAIFRVRTEELFQLLIQYGANIHIKDIFGRCPVANHFLYIPPDFPRMGVSILPELATSTPLAILFFDEGLDVNSRDIYGSSLLHYAAWHADFNMVEVLLRRGVPKDTVDDRGFTPFDLAVDQENYEVLDALKIDLQDENLDDKSMHYKMTNSYASLIIHHTNAEDMVNTLKMVQLTDEPEKIVNTLMSSPRTCLSDKLSETLKVKNDINDLMNRIASFVTDFDNRFRCHIFPTGSSAEGSQIGDPLEMDFVFCLSYFNEHCNVLQPEDLRNSGFANLKLKDYENSRDLAVFTDDNEQIRSDLIRNRFQDLVTLAVNRQETWVSNNLYFDGLLEYPDDKPIVNLKVQWYGAIAKDMAISIDMVPAIHKTNWHPNDTEIDDTIMSSETIDGIGFFLLFHVPREHSTDEQAYVRISCAPLEIKLLQSIPSVFRESYALSKALKSPHFCPNVQFSDEEDSDSDEEENEFESSNCSNLKISSDFRQSYQKETEQSPSISKNGNSTEVDECAMIPTYQTASGWVVSLDETQVVRKLYIPKENKLQSIEKAFEKLTDCRNIKGINATEKHSHIICSRKEDKANICQTSSSVCSEVSDRFPNETISCINQIENQNGALKVPEVDDESGTRNKPPVFDPAVNASMGSLVDGDHNVNPPTETNASRPESSVEDNNSLPESDLDLVGGSVVPAKDEISSYMLKNAMFYVMKDIKVQNITGITHLNLTRNIFQTLLEATRKKKLKVYFLPYVDIFSYVNTHIRMVPTKSAEKELDKHCKRIESFCNVILGILSQET